MKQDSDDYDLDDEYDLPKLPILPKGRKPLQNVDVAWYRKDQWSRLLEIAGDREKLEDSYEDWVKIAEKTMREMEVLGLSLVNGDVDVEELLMWCQKRKIPVNGAARARFTSAKLQELSEGKKDGGEGNFILHPSAFILFIGGDQGVAVSEFAGALREGVSICLLG